MNLGSLVKALWVFIAALLMGWIGQLILPGSASVVAIATVGAILTFLIERKQTNNNDSDKME
ncbi:MAG: hypothetical protein HFE77_05260 [Clostridiales bacterium]|nr:hypothetical protein [Clostridiales bacterium]